MNIRNVVHPHYDEYYEDWCKWRLAYKGGRHFIERYLEKYSERESIEAFVSRKKLTCCPAHAKAAVNDIKNSIFQRMVDISRKGGSKTYMEAVTGNNLGVDLLGSSMNSFIGRKILPEMLSMKKVGVYIDMPILDGDTLADQQGKKPYLYFYRTEDIRCWDYDEGPNANEFTSVLLRDCYYDYDETYGLPTQSRERYRLLYRQDGIVYVKFFDDEGEEEYTVQLSFPIIPFVLFEISESLLVDAADYQVALLNMNSSDINYSVKANFPFYTEQYDPRSESPHLKQQGEEGPTDTKEVKIGITEGRRYPTNLERPGFINPSSEPLEASMKKQEQMKQEIRQLVNLAVTGLQPTSAESKQIDEHSLESGLSYIGLELENGERKIAKIWQMYEGGQGPATINYPNNYTLESTEIRVARAEKLEELMLKVPSKMYQRVIAKKIASITVGASVSAEDMETINSEIDSALAMTSDPESIRTDLELGLVGNELASKLRGYPEGEVEKAKIDHGERIKRIAVAQSEAAGAARGIPDAASNPAAGGKLEKQQSRDTNMDYKVVDKTRGGGK